MSTCLRHLVRRGAYVALIVSFGFVGGGDMRAGQGGTGLLVAPTRVVFEGGQRNARLTLVNTGDEITTYRISFIQMRMTETGQIVEIEKTEVGEPYADQLVRYSPRQVTLEPHTPQTVRLQLRKPAELIPGEYRSHLLFRIIPSIESSSTLKEPSKSESDSRVIELRPFFGVAIPIIVRHGRTSAVARLTNLSLRDELSLTDPPTLSLEIRRDGNRSVYGNFTVTYLGSGGEEHVVGKVDGVAVYTSAPLRRLEIPLRLPPGLQLNDGRLRVTYAEAGSTYANARHASEILAEAEIILAAQSETESVVAEEY